MHRRAFVSVTIPALAWFSLGCDASRSLGVSQNGLSLSPSLALSSRSGSTQFATLITLPALSRNPSEALAVNRAGTVIVGYGYDRHGTESAVKWTLQPDGSWAIATLPLDVAATGATAVGVNNAGDIAGTEPPSHVVLWPAGGGVTDLSCNERSNANAISAGAQVVVGAQRFAQPPTAAVWRPGVCREDLPLPGPGAFSHAEAVNGDGTVIGGFGGVDLNSSGFPLRWRQNAGAWQLEQLDERFGAVKSANSVGDLAGMVYTPCAQTGTCRRAIIWYIAGGSRELGTLGGADSWVDGINASGEVVGGSTPSSGPNTAYFWSESSGMVPLPVSGRWVAANAISDVRPDGTRLAVGIDSRGTPVAWVVRNP